MAGKGGEDGKFPCDQTGCDYAGRKAFHLRRHKEEKHGFNPSPAGDSAAPSETLDRKTQFINTLKRAGVTDKAEAYAEVFFRGDVDKKPIRLVRLLEKYRIDPSKIELVCQLWFDRELDDIREEAEDEEKDEEEEGEEEDRESRPTFRKSLRREREDVDPVKAARRQLRAEFEEQRMRLEMAKMARQMDEFRALEEGRTNAAKAREPARLVPYTMEDGTQVDVTTEELIKLKRAEAVAKAKQVPQAPARKMRMLDGVGAVEMTDDEFRDYQVQLSFSKRNQGSQERDVDRLLRDAQEKHSQEMRELKAAFDRREEDHRWSELRREMEDVRAAAQHDPFANYLRMKEMAEHAGLATRPIDQQKLTIESTKVEKMLGGMLAQQAHHHKLVEEGVGAAKDVLVEMKKAEIRAAQGLPPEQQDYAIQEGGEEAAPDASA